MGTSVPCVGYNHPDYICLTLRYIYNINCLWRHKCSHFKLATGAGYQQSVTCSHKWKTIPKLFSFFSSQIYTSPKNDNDLFSLTWGGSTTKHTQKAMKKLLSSFMAIIGWPFYSIPPLFFSFELAIILCQMPMSDHTSAFCWMKM